MQPKESEMDDKMTIADVADWARPAAIDGNPQVVLWSILSGRYDVGDARKDFYGWLAKQPKGDDDGT